MDIKKVLNEILLKFETNDIPEAIVINCFPIPNIPSAKWSILNRIIISFSGTQDARGFRQWIEAKRFVKKGAKAIYILAPKIKTIKGEEDKHILSGFLAVPVFPVEMTEGEPLDYQNIELPELPLMDKAKEWGVSVVAIPGNYFYRGYFCESKQLIALATDHEKTFFHELSHSAHSRLEKLKGGQDPSQEIIAELSAQALCKLVGKQMDNTLGNSYEYIKEYASQTKTTPIIACLKVIGTVEKVLHLILTPKEDGEFVKE